MQRPQQPTAPLDHAVATSEPAAYDWGQFGRHRLRVPAGVLIDSPVSARAGVWLGTLWPDDRAPGGWTRMLWEPDVALRRGWTVPARMAGGDVIEFGADQPGTVVRWYGIVDSYDAVEWLTLQGPYPHPAAAMRDADRLLADIRYQSPTTHVDGRHSRTTCRRRQHRGSSS
jgi:hypothetical protein